MISLHQRVAAILRLVLLSASEVVKSESERWVVLVTIWQSHQHTLHHYSHSSTVFNSLHLVHMMLIWWWCLQDHLSPQWSRAAQSLHSKLWTMLVSSQHHSSVTNVSSRHQTTSQRYYYYWDVNILNIRLLWRQQSSLLTTLCFCLPCPLHWILSSW